MTRLLLVCALTLLIGCTGRTPPPEDLEARAAELAQRFIIADGHVDLPYRLHVEAEDVSTRTENGDFDFPRARAGGLDAPFMSIYVPAEREEEGGAKALADELIDLVESIAAGAPESFAVATTVNEVRANHAAGRISLLMGMENGSPIEGDLANLSHFHARGIRYVTLAHSKDNHLADSSYDDRHTWDGLSPFGREAVAEMNRLGMMVDVSHLSDDAARDAIEISKAPVIASHSGCRAFTPDWERNISDELIRQLAAGGGVVMINFGSSFLRDDVRQRATEVRDHVRQWAAEQGLEADDDRVRSYRRQYLAENAPGYADVGDVVDHIDHVVELVGIDHVGLGSDFDGVGDSLPTGLKDVSQYPNLIRALLERGYDEPEIEKICSGNLFRVMAEVEHVAIELQGAD